MGTILLAIFWAGRPRMKLLFLVLTVDATPDTGELKYNEIKTRVELATGRLGLRRTAQEHSFPRMLHQVGFAISSQPAADLLRPEALLAPDKQK